MKRYKFLKLFLIFTLFSLLSIYFLVPGFLTEIILPYYPDTYIAAGILMHNMKTISACHFSDLYHFPVYYPYSFTLTAGVNFFGQSLLLLPFYIIGFKNIYFLYNLMIVLSLILGGFSIYYLTRDFIQNEFLSIAAGAVYILHPIKQINYPHPAMLFFPLSILTVHFLLRYIRESRRRDAFFFYVFLFLQALFSLSLFFLTSLFCMVLFLISLAIKRKISLKNIAQLSIGLILLTVFILAVFHPYISNPLDIDYQEQSLKRRVLIPSINFYSSWFPLTFNFLRGRPYPLHLGIMASFLMFFYFFSKAKTKAVKTANYTLLVLLVLPFLLKFWRVIPLEYLYKALDVSMLSLIAVFAVNTVFIWKKILIHEKVVLGLLIFVFLSYFGAIHRYIPFEYNFLNMISAIFPWINRLRGVWRLQYFFIFPWILLAFLGSKAFVQNIKSIKKRALIIGAISAVMLFENFPTPLRVGPFLEYDHSVKNLYNKIEDYPDYFGVLELPYHRGGWQDFKIYSLMTHFHNKHIYNGHYGVGIYDTLEIFKNGYFLPAENIPRDIVDKEILSYLRDHGVKIIIFHKSMLDIGKSSRDARPEMRRHFSRLWSDIISGFKKAGQIGLLSKVEVLPEGIVGIIAEKRKGETFLYQLPYYSLKSKRYILLDIEKTNQESVRISVSLNGQSLYEDTLQDTEKQLAIRVPDKKTLKARGNQLEIKCTGDVIMHKCLLSRSPF